MRVRALALSSFDVPNGHELVVRNCEDCACPVSAERVQRTLRVPPDGPLVRAAGVLEQPLDDEHSVLFGSRGTGGVVVVNRVARDIFSAFAAPSTVADVASSQGCGSGEAEAVVTRLVEHELLHEPGVAPLPAFSESNELTAWLHVTNACNLRCTYCYVHKSKEGMDVPGAQEIVDQLVRSAVSHGFEGIRLKYAGGEASLNPEVLLALHDHAASRCAEKQLGLSAVLLSNGVVLTDALVAQLKSRSIRVMISLDALGEAHDAQRPTLGGKPSAHRVVRTIGRLVDAGLPPHLSITITGKNTAEVASVVRFALERDLTFSFNFFRDNDCAATFADLQYSEQSLVDGLREAFAVIEELLPPWSVLGSVLDRGQLVSPRRKACGVGDDYVVVDQNGHIAQCHMEIGTTLGDIRSVDPVDAVRGATGIRNLLVEDKAGCRDCTWRNWCAGGCSVATFRATGRFDVRSPNCNIYQTIYPQALRLEGLRVLRFSEPRAMS